MHGVQLLARCTPGSSGRVEERARRRGTGARRGCPARPPGHGGQAVEKRARRRANCSRFARWVKSPLATTTSGSSSWAACEQRLAHVRHVGRAEVEVRDVEEGQHRPRLSRVETGERQVRTGGEIQRRRLGPAPWWKSAARAIIAALSVASADSDGRGDLRRPRPAASASRSAPLAATPPPSTTRRHPVDSTARSVLPTSTSTTAAWKEAATFARSASSRARRLQLTDAGEHGGLETAEGEVVTVAGSAGSWTPEQHGPRKGVGSADRPPRPALDRGPARIAEPQDLRHLVERLAGGIVPGLAEQLVRAPRRHPQQHGVAARDQQRHEGRLGVRVLQLRGEQVRLHVVHADHGPPQRPGRGLRPARAPRAARRSGPDPPWPRRRPCPRARRPPPQAPRPPRRRSARDGRGTRSPARPLRTARARPGTG